MTVPSRNLIISSLPPTSDIIFASVEILSVTKVGVNPTDRTSRLLREFSSPLANRIVLF